MGRKLEVEIIGDASSLEKAFKKSTRSAKSFESRLGGLAKGAAFTAGAAGLGGLALAARAGFKEMFDAQKVTAQTNAVLKSTGGVANITAKQIDDLSSSLLKKTGVDDEQIKSGENLLLTFRDIRNETGKGNDVFNQATKAALDMSVAMGTDMKSAALTLGKALNDPAAGLSKLTRQGVTFTDAQKDQIKALQESGRTMEAQKVILRELSKEFGGSAEAAGKTLGGQLNILRETLNNTAGTMAETLAPSITRVTQELNAWLGDTKNQQRIQADFKEVVKDVAGAARTASNVFEKFSDVLGGNKHAVEVLVGSLVAFKALKVASTATTMARSFGLLTSATTAAGGMSAARLGLVGKAGLVGAAGAASFELTTLALKASGLDKEFRKAGSSAFDLAAAIGLVHDAGAQFAGKTTPSQGQARSLRQQAARLEARGLSPAQAALQLGTKHPLFAARDLQVLAGVLGAPPRLAAPVIPRHVSGTFQRPITVVVEQSTNLDGRVLHKSVTRHEQVRQRRNPQQKRGPHGI